MLAPTATIAIAGFGAQSARLAATLAPRGCALRAFDPRLDGALRSTVQRQIEAAGIDVAASLADLVRGARLVVFDTMRPDDDSAALLAAGQLVLDLAPGAHGGSDPVRRRGAHYLHGVVHAPAAPGPTATRLTIAGERASGLVAALLPLGVAAEVAPAAWQGRELAPCTMAGNVAASDTPPVHRGGLP